MEEEISMQDILNKINNILEKISFIQQEELSVISKFYSYEDFIRWIFKIKIRNRANWPKTFNPTTY